MRLRVTSIGWWRAGRWLLLVALAWLALLSIRIVWTGQTRNDGPANVAIVLGAAVYDDRASPVFEERIRHAVALYRSGRVRRLLFTGGVGAGDRLAESVVGARGAIAHGVPRRAILIETRSHTTVQNLDEAARLLRPAAGRVLVVSDPLHLSRALRIARDKGLDADGSPTPTTRYRSLWPKAQFLLHELYFTHVYLLTGR